MQGEKIDIIPWSPDIATFVVNALQPASVSRVVIDEEEERIEVVVPDDQLSLAIGRRGQNVRLASQLTGKAIDILTEQDASEKRQKEFTERTEMFQNELDVDETLAQLLVAEGFGALEEVAYVELDEIAGIEGFDEDLGQELQSRAQEALDRREAANREERIALGVEDALIDMPYLTEAMLVTLGKAGIKTLDDLADLATDELVEKKRVEPRRRNEDAPKRPEPKGGILAEYGLSDEQGNEIIMAARQHWFADDEAPAAAEAADDDADAADAAETAKSEAEEA
jgi:N utilization substance protein A